MAIKRINPRFRVILALLAVLTGIAAFSAYAATPSTWKWTDFGASQFSARTDAAATLVNLPSNASAVLVAGGQYRFYSDMEHPQTIYNSYEIYHPDTNSWTYVESKTLQFFRSQHTAALLTQDPYKGMVLVAGGLDKFGNPQATCEIYDPGSPGPPAVPDSWNATQSLHYVRVGHIAIQTNDADGRVVVAGCLQDVCEIFGPTPPALLLQRQLFGPVK